MNYKMLIDVIKEAKKGKTIQIKELGWSSWENTKIFDLDKYEFRVKPEELICWMRVYDDGTRKYYDVYDDAIKDKFGILVPMEGIKNVK